MKKITDADGREMRQVRGGTNYVPTELKKRPGRARQAAEFRYKPDRARLLECFEDLGYTVKWKIPSVDGKPRRTPIVRKMNVHGYLMVIVDGFDMAVHRILWTMRNGEIPKGAWVDHKDRVRTNNQDGNLRLCTPAENLHNATKKGRNTSGYKNVSWVRKDKVWRVAVMANGETFCSTFKSLEDAVACAAEVRDRMHKGFVHHC